MSAGGWIAGRGSAAIRVSWRRSYAFKGINAINDLYGIYCYYAAQGINEGLGGVSLYDRGRHSVRSSPVRRHDHPLPDSRYRCRTPRRPHRVYHDLRNGAESPRPRNRHRQQDRCRIVGIPPGGGRSFTRLWLLVRDSSEAVNIGHNSLFGPLRNDLPNYPLGTRDDSRAAGTHSVRRMMTSPQSSKV